MADKVASEILSRWDIIDNKTYAEILTITEEAIQRTLAAETKIKETGSS